MEEKNRFRNHISVIVERTGAGFWILLGILFWQVLEDPELIRDITSTEDGLFWFLVFVAGILAVIFLILFIQYIIWSKTYIYVDGTSIVIEKNTLKYQKKTIGIKNISNINTEQNMFEMILGTCKVKMDTDSMSTADSTDLTIVLKKKEAEEFKTYILGLMNEKGTVFSVEKDGETGNRYDRKEAGVEQMMIHGLLSIRLFTVLVALAAIGGLMGIVYDVVSAGTGELLGRLSSILILVFLAFSSIWSIIKEFLQYYGFSVDRKGDRLHIQYGLLKIVNYTIPVDKINAVRLVQSPQARFMKYYTVDLINVGMGDNEEEKSFFLMYDKVEHIREEIRRLLPEFADCQEKEIKHQPASVWMVWTIPFFLFIVILCACMLAAVELFPETLFIASPIVMGILCLAVLWIFLKYKTEGCTLTEDVFAICKGSFGREVMYVKYDKIQYISSKQNFLAKRYHIQKATVFLLASTVNRNHDVPYFAEDELEQLKERLLDKKQ